MKLTIGQKLAGGFSVALVLMVCFAGVALVNMNRVLEANARVVGTAVPAVELCRKLEGEIHHAISVHRGSMILGLDAFDKERLASWDLINGYIAQLDGLAASWPDAEMLAQLDEFKAVLAQLRDAQQQIADVVRTDADRPAMAMFTSEALPSSEAMSHHLQAILRIEDGMQGNYDRRQLVRVVGAAESSLLKSRALLASYIASGSADDLAKVETGLGADQASVERLKPMAGLLGKEQAQHYGAFLAARAKFLETSNKALAIRSQADDSVSGSLFASTVTPLSNRAITLVGSIAGEQEAIRRGSVASSESAAASMITSLWTSASIAVLISATVAFFLSRSITMKLGKVVAYAERIASRDLSQTTLDVKPGDEIGKLASSMVSMNETLRRVIGDVSAATHEVAGAASQISASNEKRASGMTDQTREIEQICSAVNEMAASIEAVASRAESVTANARSSGEIARDSGMIVSQTIEGLCSIDEAVAGSAASVQELGRRSDQIGEIISVINEIADQTNLLALNASIEAARAGEHGRGFVVVADEVRRLAQRTTRATEEVSESISAIQAETARAVSRMSSGTSNVRDGVELANRAGESLGRIVTSTESVTSAVVSIAETAKAQAIVSNNAGNAIEKIRAAAQQSNVGTQKDTAAASQINAKSEALSRLVMEFRL